MLSVSQSYTVLHTQHFVVTFVAFMLDMGKSFSNPIESFIVTVRGMSNQMCSLVADGAVQEVRFVFCVLVIQC